MPIYDRCCDQCGKTQIDVFEPVNTPDTVCACGGRLKRVWLASEKGPSIIGDEIDVVIKNGLCWPDGTPRHFTSREELKRVEKASRWRNEVEHRPISRGSDKSPHTTRWF